MKTIFLVVVLVHLTYSAGSCDNVSDCSLFQCLEGRVQCGLEEHPAREAFYLCNKLNHSRENFNEKYASFVNQILSCSINSTKMKFMSGSLISCDGSKRTIGDAFSRCISVNSAFFSDCEFLRAVGRTIFSEDILTLHQSRLIANHFWSSLLKQVTRNLDCSGLDTNLQTSLALEFKGCSEPNAKLIVIIDSSDSVGRTIFDKMIHLAADIITSLPVNISVAIIRFDNRASIIHSFVKPQSLTELAEEVLMLDYTGGQTNTAAAIKSAIDMFRSNSVQQCSITRSRHVILLMTDGRSNNMQESITAAQDAKNSHNVNIYSIAAGMSINRNELNSLVSSPMADHLHDLSNFDERSFMSKFQRLLWCNVPAILNARSCTNEEISLQASKSQSLQLISLPDRFTFHFDVYDDSQVGIYGSFAVRNPNPITADFRIMGSDELYYYVEETHGRSLFLNIVTFSSSNATVMMNIEHHDTTNIRLVDSPSSLTADYGMSIELNCTAEGSGLIALTWQELSHGIIKINTFTDVGGNVSSTLNLTAFTNESYICMLRGEGHLITSPEANITVFNAPSTDALSSSGVGSLKSGVSSVLCVWLLVVMLHCQCN